MSTISESYIEDEDTVPETIIESETFNKRQDKIRKICSYQNTNSNTNITSQLLFKYH